MEAERMSHTSVLPSSIAGRSEGCLWRLGSTCPERGLVNIFGNSLPTYNVATAKLLNWTFGELGVGCLSILMFLLLRLLLNKQF